MTIPLSTLPKTLTAVWAICQAALPVATNTTRPPSCGRNCSSARATASSGSTAFRLACTISCASFLNSFISYPPAHPARYYMRQSFLRNYYRLILLNVTSNQPQMQPICYKQPAPKHIRYVTSNQPQNTNDMLQAISPKTQTICYKQPASKHKRFVTSNQPRSTNGSHFSMYFIIASAATLASATA